MQMESMISRESAVCGPAGTTLAEGAQQMRAGGKPLAAGTGVSWREIRTARPLGFLIGFGNIRVGNEACSFSSTSFFSTVGTAAWEVVTDHRSGDLWLCTWLWTLGSPWDLSRVSWRQPLLCRAGKQLQGPQQ